MAGPVYKFWRSRMKGAWYQLSEEEQNAPLAKAQEALEKVGAKTIVMATPVWANEEWTLCGVEEFPSVEAVQEHTQLLFDIDHHRYSEGESMLATKWPPS
jgi:hypothetical protein